MDFTNLVLAARPNIKPNSAKTYATSLKLLAPDGATSLEFLSELTSQHAIEDALQEATGGASGNDDDDEVPDEVILFNPSPPLTRQQTRERQMEEEDTAER